MRKLVFLWIMCLSFSLSANHWEPNPYQFQNNMTVTAIISFDGVEQRSDMLEIGAFYGDECRGSSIAQYEEIFDRYMIYLMVYGDSNDSIRFRCYNHSSNMELDMMTDNYIIFQANAMIGNAVEPYIFDFQSYTHNINIDLLPDIAGSVIGDGVYDRYDTCFIEIAANDNYHFEALIEGDDTLTTLPYYSFIVLSDRHFEAHFTEIPTYYQVTAETSPNVAGSISGTGEYLENSSCTLEITANSGYDYIGLFEGDHLITTNDSYTFTVSSDRHFTAKFQILINYYQVTADIFPDESGVVNGLGAYQEDEICTLEMISDVGYEFVALKENGEIVSDESSFSFIVDSDRHFTAEFAPKTFEIILSAEPEEGGTVSGSGSYSYGENVYAIAINNDNYIFSKWTNEEGVEVSKNPQYVFTATESRELVANFEYIDNIEEYHDKKIMFYPNPAKDMIFLHNIENLSIITITDIFGRIKIEAESIEGNMLDISELERGIYIITTRNEEKTESSILLKRD